MPAPIPLAARQRVYRVLSDEFPFDRPVPMAKAAKAIMDAGSSKAAYGRTKLEPFFAEMDDFLDFADTVAGGVPQRLVTARKREDRQSSDAVPAPNHGLASAPSSDANPPETANRSRPSVGADAPPLRPPTFSAAFEYGRLRHCAAVPFGRRARRRGARGPAHAVRQLPRPDHPDHATILYERTSHLPTGQRLAAGGENEGGLACPES